MKLRLRAEIEKARAHRDDDRRGARARFDRRARASSRSRASARSTRFCADLLRERPVEARRRSALRGRRRGRARAPARRAPSTRWFERSARRSARGRAARAAAPRARAERERPARAAARAPCDALLEHRDFPAPLAPRSLRARRRDRRAARASSRELADARGARGAQRRLPRAAASREIARFVAEHRAAARRCAARDHDGLEAELRERRALAELAAGRAARPRLRPAGSTRDEVLARRDAAKQALDALLERADADLAPLPAARAAPRRRRLRGARSAAPARSTSSTCSCARATCCATTPAVRAELQARFTHFFVDEFQDTDPLQAEILLLLAARRSRRDATGAARAPSPGKLFLVGDPKQSIYRFRRADVAIYEEVKQPARRERRRASLQLDDQLPQRAGDPGGGERGVRAA